MGIILVLVGLAIIGWGLKERRSRAAELHEPTRAGAIAICIVGAAVALIGGITMAV
jgi:hypothetical protein